MENKKIIQIIPTSEKFFAVYEDKGKEIYYEIICWALVECEDSVSKTKDNLIEGVTTDECGADLAECDNFVRYESETRRNELIKSKEVKK